MEDFPIALILIILSIVSSVMKNKKKQEKKAMKQARKQVPVSPHKPVQAKPAPAVPAMSVWDEAERELAPLQPAAPSMGREGTDACHDYMLPSTPKAPMLKTLENHSPAAPVMGMEGSDLCHDFMLEDTAQIQTETMDENCMAPEEAQELVRGIILSEIFTRPRNRYARRMP